MQNTENICNLCGSLTALYSWSTFDLSAQQNATFAIKFSHHEKCPQTLFCARWKVEKYKFGNDQKKAQSERNYHSKNQGGKHDYKNFNIQAQDAQMFKFSLISDKYLCLYLVLKSFTPVQNCAPVSPIAHLPYNAPVSIFLCDPHR